MKIVYFSFIFSLGSLVSLSAAETDFDAGLKACRAETARIQSGNATSLARENALAFLREFNEFLNTSSSICGALTSSIDRQKNNCETREILRECLFQRNESYLATLARAGFTVERPVRSPSDVSSRQTPAYDLERVRIVAPENAR